MKLRDKILDRNHSDLWLKSGHEIVKYNPANYDENGCYRKEEWTSICDVGKLYDGKTFTIEEYLETEQRYVDVVCEIVKRSNIKYLTIGYLEKDIETIIKCIGSSRFQLYDAPLLQTAKSMEEGKRISIKDVANVVRLCLREYLYIVLVNERHKLQIDFGYDYYMNVHSRLDGHTLQNITNKYRLYLDPCSLRRY